MPQNPHLLRFFVCSIFTVGAACILTITLCWSTAQQNGLDFEGRHVDPLRETSGKVNVLVFLRTDCPISNRYAPVIQQLSSKYANNTEFWLVYPARAESAITIRKHLQEYGYKLRALRDPDQQLVKRSQVQITPEVAVFTTDGQLAYHGRIDNWYQDFGRSRASPTTHELDDAIQAALAGKSVAPSATDAVGCYISDLK